MSATAATGATVGEDVDSFTLRAREWLKANMPPARPDQGAGLGQAHSDEEELARVARCRQLQRMLYTSADCQEGIAAFRERRAPRWAAR